MLVGNLAINALVPPPTPKALSGSGGDPFNQLQGLTGTSNQAIPYGTLPCAVGTARFFPPHAALPYTEISGDDQYLRMLLDLGHGELDISDIRIGETALAEFDDVEWEIGTAPSLFTQDIYELQVGTSLSTSGAGDTRTTQAATDEISLDMVFPGGLFGVNGRGATVSGTTSFTVQYRLTGSSTWLSATAASGLTTTGGLSTSGANFLVRSAARKTLRCGLRWKVASGQYDVKVTRNSTSFNGAQSGGTVGDAAWSVLRSIAHQQPSHTGTLKLALRIKATDQLNGVVQSLSVLAAQRIPSYDTSSGTWLAPAESQNPAWIYAWLMTRCPAVVRRLADTRLDLESIADWAAECDAKGYKIGFVMDSARAFGDVLRDVLAAGRASFGLRNGKYSAVRDIQQTVPVQMFTPANSSGFSYSRAFGEPPHALRVKFTNPEAGYQEDVRMVYADGHTEATATRFEELDLRMVVDPDAAWRLGRYHLAVIYNRPTQYVFDADVEHLVCERGDLIHVAHDIVGWGTAWGRIKAIAGSTVTLDGAVDPDPVKDYAFRVRKDDGTQATQNVVSWAADSVTLSAPIAQAHVGDLFVLGEVNHGVAKLIVRAIEPGNDLTARVTCVDAAPDVWAADAGTPPAFVSEITGKAWCAPPDPPDLSLIVSDAPLFGVDDGGIRRPGVGIAIPPQGGIYRMPISGGGCVAVDSLLPGGKRAGDVQVGDTLELADEMTLVAASGVVSYSEAKEQPCVEIATESGVTLLCSTSAPIPTPDGLVLAPDLAGRQVAVRVGTDVRWERVKSLCTMGRRMVQHITVGNACFWAGTEAGYILHHNMKNAVGADFPRYRVDSPWGQYG